MTDLLPAPPTSWRGRAAALRDGLPASSGTIASAALALVALVVVGTTLLREPSAAGPAPASRAARSGGSARPWTPPTTQAPDVVVHVAGAVLRAGIQHLRSGARIADAVTAAGGPLPEADLDAVNLAAKLGDGDRVYVPRRGEVVTAPAGGGVGGQTTPAVLDLNSATAEQLDALPGIGPATAQAIVAYRSEHGRFRSVDGLHGPRDRPVEAGRAPLPVARVVGEVAAIAMAAAAAAGALAARPVPLSIALLVLAAGWAARRAALLIVGVALVASAMAARSWAGLHPPLTGWFDGTGTLAGDPVDVEGALRVDIRVGGKRVEAWARGPAAAALRERLSGERVRVAGRVQPLPNRLRVRRASRHVAARMSVKDVGAWSPGAPLTRAANGLRRTLINGAASLRPDRRALFAGFVLGDDRGQPAEVVSDFRLSGLTHLLVVSGENVAFVLALASPLLTRLRLTSRVAVGVAVLIVFGTLVRWEPSVVRAEAMATLALVASAMGRPAGRLRLLALAVTGVLLVDPLLVRSVGFLMSVGASAGIALLAAPIARVLPGPRTLASAMSVTIGAQVGVAPVLIPVFGGLPLASLPANLLAVPAAGPIMMWGFAAGVPAGMVGGVAAHVAHLPTDVLVAWVADVARVSAALPLGELDGRTALLLGAALTLVGFARSQGARAVVGTAMVVLVLGGPVASAVRPPPCAGCSLGDGVRLWRSRGEVVLVIDRARASILLARVRGAHVRRVHVLVLTRAGVASRRAADALATRVPVGLMVTSEAVVTGRQFRVQTTRGERGIETRVEPLRSPP